MAQVVKCLLCKYDGVSSDPQPPCNIQLGHVGKTDKFSGSPCHSPNVTTLNKSSLSAFHFLENWLFGLVY